MKKEIALEYELIFLCAQLQINASIQQKIRDILTSPLDWNKIIEISNRHGISPLLYYHLNKFSFQDIIPKEAFSVLKNYYYANLNRNLMFEKEILDILGLTAEKKLTAIPIKGFALIHNLYHNPGLRIINDIDILVKQNEYQSIRNIFIHSGYKESIIRGHHKEYWHKAIFSKMVSQDTFLSVEIHAMLAYARPYEIKIPDMWKRIYKNMTDSQGLFFLSKEDTFLSLILHLRSHTRWLILKFIMDINELLNVGDTKLDWQYIIKIAKDNHIRMCVYLFSYIAKETLGTSIPIETLNEFRPNIIKIWLIKFTINKYNFLEPKKWQGILLRFLLFDSLPDFLLYLWQVSFLERFAFKLMPKNAVNK